MAETDGGSGPRKGVAGPYSFYQRKGKTIIRSRNNRRSDKGRTAKSMAQRTAFTNLIHQWRAFGGGLKDCFETKKEGATDYSGYLSVNCRSARVHLTKQQSEGMVTVAENICVSSGSLQPVVQVVEREGWMLSDIRLEGLELGPETPMLRLCAALSTSNPGRFRDGDELRFLRLTQWVDQGIERPYVEAEVKRLVFKGYRQETVAQCLGSHYMDKGFNVRGGVLCAEARQNSLVAWVHLRRDPKGGVLVTTQNLVGTNVLLARFTSEEQLQEAIHSYGPLKQGLRHAEPRPVHNPSPRPEEEPLTPTEIMEDKVVITSSVSPSGTGTATGGGTCTRGMELTLRATPTEGYHFLCWDDEDMNPTRTVTATESECYTAIFVKDKKYNV